MLRIKNVAFVPWLLAAVGALGMSVRAALYFPIAAFPVDSDGVLAGLCALRVQGGAFPMFFPGGSRLSAASCYVTAAYLHLAGDGRIALALTGLTWAALYLGFTALFLRELLPARAAIVALLFAAIPPAAFMVVTYVPWAYGEIMASCAATLWLAARWRRRGDAWHCLAFGVSAGFGLWISLQTLMIALPAAAWIVLSRRPGRREWVPALAGAFAGSTPLLLANAATGFATVTHNWASQPVSSLPQAWDNALWLVTSPMPQLFFYGLGAWNSPSTLLIAGYLLAGAGFVLALHRPGRDRDAALPVANVALLLGSCLLASCAIYVLSDAGSVRGWTVRYIAPLYTIAPLFLGIGVAKLWGASRWLGAAAAALLLVPNLLLYSLPGSGGRAVLAAQWDTDRRLLAELRRDRVGLIYGDYFTAYHYNFDGAGSVVAIPSLEALDYLGYERSLPRSTRWAYVTRDPAELRAAIRHVRVPGTIVEAGDVDAFVAARAADPNALLRALRAPAPK